MKFNQYQRLIGQRATHIYNPFLKNKKRTKKEGKIFHINQIKKRIDKRYENNINFVGIYVPERIMLIFKM